MARTDGDRSFAALKVARRQGGRRRAGWDSWYLETMPQATACQLPVNPGSYRNFKRFRKSWNFEDAARN